MSLHVRPGVSVCLCVCVRVWTLFPTGWSEPQSFGCSQAGGEVLTPGGAQSSGQAGLSRFSLPQAPWAPSQGGAGSTGVGEAASGLGGS